MNGTGDGGGKRWGWTASGVNDLTVFIVIVILSAAWAIKFALTDKVDTTAYERVLIFFAGAAFSKVVDTAVQKGVEKGANAALTPPPTAQQQPGQTTTTTTVTAATPRETP